MVRISAQTVEISTRDILPNYGIDAAFVDDTNLFIMELKGGEGDNLAKQELCKEWAAKIQRTVMEITTDYPRRDSLIWLDSNIYISDWNRYEERLATLAAIARRYKAGYAEREEQRLVEEQKAAAEREALEEKQRQQLLEIQIGQMADGIEQRHRRVIDNCRTDNIVDKARVKELKDIYYAYLSVYNQYDVKARKFTPDHKKQMEEFMAFQDHLLDSVLGFGAYNAQIDNFKNELRIACGERHADIYRSYCKVFKKSPVPVNFTNIEEYHQYIKNVYQIKMVQESYLTIVHLRDSIRYTGDSIIALASKNHRDIAVSYASSQEATLQTPTFTTSTEGRYFLGRLRTFRQVQRQYMTSIEQRNEILRNSELIYKNRELPRTVVNYYKIMENVSPLTPDFSTLSAGEEHLRVLRDFRSLQDTFMLIIARIDTIASNERRIKNLSRSYINLSRAYNKLSKEVVDNKLQVLNERDFEEYKAQQVRLLDLQMHFLLILNNAGRRNDIETRLKGIIDMDKVRLIINS